MEAAAGWRVRTGPQRALVEVIGKWLDLKIERRVEQVAFDQRAFAGTFTRLQGRDDAEGCQRRRVLVDDRGSDWRGRGIGFAGDNLISALLREKSGENCSSSRL